MAGSDDGDFEVRDSAAEGSINRFHAGSLQSTRGGAPWTLDAQKYTYNASGAGKVSECAAGLLLGY